MKNAKENFKKMNLFIYLFLVPYLYEYYKNLQISPISFISVQQRMYLFFCYYNEHDILYLLEEHAIFRMIKGATTNSLIIGVIKVVQTWHSTIMLCAYFTWKYYSRHFFTCFLLIGSHMYQEDLDAPNLWGKVSFIRKKISKFWH
jgi:hypothetical protein